MNILTVNLGVPSREQLLYALYEAAELEHNLMCTYLYAAFSLKSGEAEGLSARESEAVSRWRQSILDVATDEMSHLAAVWNITAALGGAPRFGRTNFPLDPGLLPAGVVVKLAPFNPAVLQHFIYLERPHGSSEPDGEGFAPERLFERGAPGQLLTPMGMDYDTVGDFYQALGDGLRRFVSRLGEDVAFCGDPARQLSQIEAELAGAKPVLCSKTALAAFDAIVAQGEGAPLDSKDSHFQKFLNIRTEYAALRAQNPQFAPAFPAAHNPVLRRPPRPAGRVWIEDTQAAMTVDLANASYSLMLRLIAYAYSLSSPNPQKAAVLDLSVGVMRAMTLVAERAARLPAGPANPDCNAGMSFTAPRDSSALPTGAGAQRFFIERFHELASVAAAADQDDARMERAARLLRGLAERAARAFAQHDDPVKAVTLPTPQANMVSNAPPQKIENGVEIVEGEALTLMFESKRCIHARFCVTGAPAVFLANVQGPWIHPDAMDKEELAAIGRECPSGAIRYKRKDGRPDESAPPVNLIAIREAGPYAVRADMTIDGAPAGFRATLCRCGASRNKPYCDGSHHDTGFDATGEPATTSADMLAVRNGVLAIDPQMDGPLQIRGNLEITSGTGRVVARVQTARLCRCGGSKTKPFCDGTHAKIGFRSE